MKQKAKYRILIVAATKLELNGISSFLTLKKNKIGSKKIEFEFLIAGIGMVSTSLKLTRFLCLNKVDLILNIGICGSFKKNIKIGDVVNIAQDNFSEIGAQDGLNFLNAFEIGLIKKDELPYKKGVLTGLKSKLIKNTVLNNFVKVNGITVNTVHGNTSSIKKIKQRLNPDVESMEGAAVFYVANSFKIPALQLRAVSNYVVKRNKETWNIPLALENLNSVISEFLTSGIKYGN